MEDELASEQTVSGGGEGAGANSKPSVIRRANGQVLGTPETAAHALAAKLAKRRQRQEQAERMARDALAEYAETHSPEEVERYAQRKGPAFLVAWRDLVAAQIELAAEGKKGSTLAFKAVGQAAGLLPDARDAIRHDEGAMALPPGPSVILTPGAMEVLLRRMAEIRAHEAEAAHAGPVVDGYSRPANE